MKRVFVYPNGDLKKSNSKNPYIQDLIQSIHQNFVNNSFNNFYGVFDLILNFLKTDVFIINWPENIPLRKYGILQSLSYILFLNLIRLSPKKVIFILHNKYAHNKKGLLSKLCLNQTIHIAKMIITHSKEGISYIENKYKLASSKRLYYIPHPIKAILISDKKNMKAIYTYLIWGNIEPYKGIINFLDHFTKSVFFSNATLLIYGYCSDTKYANEIKKYLDKNNRIKHINRFIEESELAKIANLASIILFTYCSDSVLSSGSLSLSLNFNKPIIGPDIGAFKDLRELGLIHTYRSFKDIEIIKVQNLVGYTPYIVENSWDKFGNKLDQFISEVCNN